MQTFRVYGYDGTVERIRAFSARGAAWLCSFAPAYVKDALGHVITPDLWAS